MKILKLKLYQETACYKKPFATKVAETYPLPPYSTVIGMFHKILQAGPGEYFPMNISIQGSYEGIFSNYQNLMMYKGKDKVTSMTRNVHQLLDVNLIIHVQAEDEIINKIYQNITNGTETFTLGRNEDIVRIDGIKIFENVNEVKDAKIEENAYVPEWLDDDVNGINYRLNTIYTIQDDIRKWNKLNVKYVEKHTNQHVNKIFQDEDGDNIYFYIKDSIQAEKRKDINFNVTNKTKAEHQYYAKSNPIETIKEHTDKLLENLEILKRTYGSKILQTVDIPEDRFWQLMEIICKYHDVGKVFSGFQNEIRKNIGETLLQTKFNNEQIKHEQISPMFVPYKEYELTKTERKLVYQAIYYHHERNNTVHIDGELLKEIMEEDIKPNISQIENELQIKVPELKTTYLGMVEGQARITEFDDIYKDYCMMKGLLHRLDHCSSAWIPVEDETSDVISEFVENFMNKQNFKQNDLQQFAKANQNKNVIVIGSTGMGKTEGALLWSNSDKTFFTLPLRISINAIYDRIKEIIGYNHVGLLHSTAIDYLDDKNEENEFEKIRQARNLYEKITTCTIDQIFPFVFKYKGYEKIYATLSYSKVVIDEVQAYSPEIVAVILKGLQMINNLNGKFMVMTATLPRIYKEKLEEMGIDFKYNEFIKDTIRHKIQLVDSGIEQDIEEIKENSKNKKVLIIVNTINKVIEIYKKLQDANVTNVNLLHSRFIQADRSEKEEKIKEFSKNRNEVGIWITTQIVEASLDIDFDMLYAEMSTLDSLFQRLGRCYRSREYNGKLPNAKIYIKDTSGVGYIYDKEIYEKSIELLKPYSGEILQENVKIDLVDKLYSKEMLQETEFYKKFKEAFKILDNIIDYDTSKKDAQHILRNIDNIDVIPKIIYDENLNLFDEYEKEKDKKKKYELKRKIDRLFISINSKNKWKLGSVITACPYVKGKYIIDTKYDKEIGLFLKVDEDYSINSREL